MTDQSQRRILVTGAAGFVGAKLVARLAQHFPSALLYLCDKNETIAPVGISRVVDVTDERSVDVVVAEARPTSIVHLAAKASVGGSHAAPGATRHANVTGVAEMLKATERHAPGCHFIFVSSAEVYGETSTADSPVDETSQLNPLNPYAESKVAGEKLVLEALRRGFQATIIRPFNHTGPGQSDKFVVPAFCSQIARIERGEQKPVMKVGELNDERDFLDVGDVVDLYLRAIERGSDVNGVIVNACSGRAQRVGDMLDWLLARANLEIKVEVDPSRLRPQRLVRMVGNPALAQKVFGWKAETPFEQTLKETLSYWRGRS